MTFLPIILLNTILGIVQEIKAKIVLDRLTVVNAPRTKVIRDSAVSEVDSVTLVKGDVCIFTAGNQLSADAILAEGCVRVNEAMVTGESDEVIKNKGDILLSGSYIVSGECKAVLTQVGHKAYAARLALEAKAGRKKCCIYGCLTGRNDSGRSVSACQRGFSSQCQEASQEQCIST